MNIVVGVVMGSKSDWDTMQHAVDTLTHLEIEYETRVVSADSSSTLAVNSFPAASGSIVREMRREM